MTAASTRDRGPETRPRSDVTETVAQLRELAVTHAEGNMLRVRENYEGTVIANHWVPDGRCRACSRPSRPCCYDAEEVDDCTRVHAPEPVAWPCPVRVAADAALAHLDTTREDA
ncbi:hypothetical protein CLV30_12855 [Haloactinopolyspora alba]|uniref:Uncharacterized protein n=1 Tax=Haloactinopolyspora alba TaxID=648780 RepID=A0A2P8DF07_9ACTN|nr:hypothetical protein [Haloactinopolyspora alba]PSK95803.1 hypothetical protein CLV30_12855 [Haloactinopolyspora alba]